MRTALLLEDEPIIAMDLEITLGDSGFDVVLAMTCVEALEWLADNRPDIVIVDIILKDGPCHEVVAKLIDDDIPFVVHAGDHPSMHEGTVFTRGRWVNKPSNGADMIDTIWELLAA